MFAHLAREAGVKPHELRAAFVDRDFYLALNTGRDFLDLDAMEQNEDRFSSDCRRVMRDLTLPGRVIDLLLDGPGD